VHVGLRWSRRSIGVRCARRAAGGELRQSLDRLRSQSRGIAGDGRFARLFNARHSPVQRSDQFRELTSEIIWTRHHVRRWLDLASRREAFQISPQLPHRQYVFASGIFAVVEIDADRHAGQTEGIAPAALDDDWPAAPLPISYDFTRSPKTSVAAQRPTHA